MAPAGPHPPSGPITLPREALENELLLASQMRTLAIVHRAYAHDVRSPLNAMQLSLELLSGMLADEAAGAAPGGCAPWQRHVSVLREELGKLNRTVQALLDQHTPLGSAAQTFELTQLVREVAAVLRGQAAQQRVQLSIDVPERPVLVQGFRDRLRQALLNLAVRALHAMPGAGRLAIGMLRNQSRCTVYVEHNGTPLAQDALRAIERLELAGSGEPVAGLCAASLVAQSHGGEMIVQSGPGSERMGLVLECVASAS
jgi:signal transduction histidine kinase